MHSKSFLTQENKTEKKKHKLVFIFFHFFFFVGAFCLSWGFFWWWCFGFLFFTTLVILYFYLFKNSEVNFLFRKYSVLSVKCRSVLTSVIFIIKVVSYFKYYIENKGSCLEQLPLCRYWTFSLVDTYGIGETQKTVLGDNFFS